MNACFLLLALLPALTAPLGATDYHVSPTGDDVAGDGSAALPWRSITRAMSATVAGDRILVEAGTYDSFNGEVLPLSVNDGVSVIGPTVGTATLDGNNIFTPILVIGDNTQTTVLQRLRFNGEVDVIEVFGNPTDLQVLDCVFLGGWRALYHSSSGDSTSLRMERNTILNMKIDGVVWEATGGAGLTQSVTLIDNHINGKNLSTDGIRLAATGNIVLDTHLSGNFVEKFDTGLRVSITASSSSAGLTGIIEGTDVQKANGDGISISLSSSGLGPSVASFNATLRHNSVVKSGGHGLRIALSAIGNTNTSEFTAPLYGNIIRRNDGSGIYISDSEIAGGVCNTTADLGGGPTGSWGGNTIDQNDKLYSTGVEFDLRVESGDPVSARGNWWGTVDPFFIEQHIFHQVDDPLNGRVDFSDPLGTILSFHSSPSRVSSVARQMVKLIAEPGSDFVARGGVVPISVTVAGILSDLVTVAADGRSLDFRMPDLRSSGGGTVSVDVLNPGGQSGTSSIEVAGDGQGGGFCFVASAAWNDPDAPEVMVLRRWRDQSLMPYPAGRALVHAYYRYSPPAASFVASHAWARRCSRIALLPLVAAVRIWLNASWIYGLLVLAGVWRMLRRSTPLP